MHYKRVQHITKLCRAYRVIYIVAGVTLRHKYTVHSHRNRFVSLLHAVAICLKIQASRSGSIILELRSILSHNTGSRKNRTIDYRPVRIISVGTEGKRQPIQKSIDSLAGPNEK